MDFLDRLRMLARTKGLENNMQLSKASGVPYTTLDNFYRNGYENVKLSTLKKLSVCLDCSIEYLVNGSPEQEEVPPEMIALARRFYDLDRHAQDVVLAVMRVEEKRLEHERFFRNYVADLPENDSGMKVGIAYQDGSVEMKYAAKREVEEVEV